MTRRALMLALVAIGSLIAAAPAGGGQEPVPRRDAVESSSAGGSSADAEPLRLGVVGFYNPRLMYLKYQPFADYLSDATGRPWKLDISTTYEETVSRLCAGELAMAYLGPFTYVQAHEACGVQPIARLNSGERPSFRSYIMVRKESGIESLEELEGARIAFGSPLSTSSHLAPRAMLSQAGLSAGRDYACAYYDHHERAARAVLLGEALACGVRDLVGERFAERGLRLLARSEPLPNFPLVGAPDLDPDLRQAIVDALITRPAREKALEDLFATWDVELAAGFAPVDDAAYESTRSLVRDVFGEAGFTAHSEELRCPDEVGSAR